LTFLPKIGGAEIFVHNLANIQYEQGHKVHIITAWNKYKRIKKIVKYKVLPFLPKSLIVSQILDKNRFKWLSKFIFSVQIGIHCIWNKIHVCHVHFAYPEGYYSIEVLNFLKIPALLTCHGGDININVKYSYGIRLNKQIDYKIRQSIVSFNVLTALSDSMKKELVNIGVLEKQIIKVPNGINISKIQINKQNRLTSLKNRNVNNKIRLLTVARNIPSKGLSMIFPIANVLNNNNIDFTWNVVGGNVDMLINEDNTGLVGDRIFLISETGLDNHDEKYLLSLPSEKILSFYHNSDIFVFLSALESFGIVVVEAMAAGLPVIAFSVPGVKDLIKPSKNGFLCEFGDITSIAEAIEKLVYNKELLIHYSENNAKYSKKYDIGIITDQFNNIYTSLINK